MCIRCKITNPLKPSVLLIPYLAYKSSQLKYTCNTVKINEFNWMLDKLIEWTESK